MSSFRSGNNGERKGPVDPHSNGTPARGLVDEAAAATLREASDLLADEGRERGPEDHHRREIPDGRHAPILSPGGAGAKRARIAA